MDENNFFREFTLRMCGSFDLREALWRCFLYVRSALPADELMLTVFDLAFGSLEVVTTADEGGGVARGDKITMDLDMRKQLEHVEHYPRVRICNDVSQDPIIEKIAIQYRWPDSSVVVGRLIIQHDFVGSLIVRATGKDRYSEEHAKLWSLVNEPAAIALANSRQYYELLKLKDLLADENRYLQNELRRGWGEKIVGADFGLREVIEQVVKVAPLTSPVLLMGETGTGKEIIANAIHNLSPRNNGPLITVNCGAIPESLIDSELFGHEKGAFTGALTERRGRFERADKGTIFLDEVGELPPQAQVRLLRVLQEKEIERVGSTHPIKVDIRIISATHRNLEKLVAAGTFRDDLYYRLGVFPINIPPLRERKADIPALVEHFIEKKAREMGLHSVPTLVPGAIDHLMRYDWPGNVREVANVIERALIQSNGKPLVFTDLMVPPAAAAPASAAIQGLASLRLEEMETLHIRRMLEVTHGRIEGKNGAAALLGINPSTLRARMRKLHIPFGRKRSH
ncbi:MAG TPA: sigma 54-interacting transcriptional regulator [Syntrophorhabdales bacterium]|nr:sigma 54-interacting transcriptional regulator [Syntrophorhabdales bacterium]